MLDKHPWKDQNKGHPVTHFANEYKNKIPRRTVSQHCLWLMAVQGINISSKNIHRPKEVPHPHSYILPSESSCIKNIYSNTIFSIWCNFYLLMLLSIILQWTEWFYFIVKCSITFTEYFYMPGILPSTQHVFYHSKLVMNL